MFDCIFPKNKTRKETHFGRSLSAQTFCANILHFKNLFAPTNLVITIIKPLRRIDIGNKDPGKMSQENPQ